MPCWAAYRLHHVTRTPYSLFSYFAVVGLVLVLLVLACYTVTTSMTAHVLNVVDSHCEDYLLSEMPSSHHHKSLPTRPPDYPYLPPSTFPLPAHIPTHTLPQIRSQHAPQPDSQLPFDPHRTHLDPISTPCVGPIFNVFNLTNLLHLASNFFSFRRSRISRILVASTSPIPTQSHPHPPSQLCCIHIPISRASQVRRVVVF